MGIPDLAEYLLYLRKSNGRKAVPRQRAITTAHVTARGGVIIGEFADRDKTAFRKIDGEQPKRDGFACMLAVLWSRPGLKVAAWHAGRLTRNPGGTGELIRGLCRRGSPGGDTAGGSCGLSAAHGRKRFRDGADDAACEVGHGRERVRAARAEVAAEGRWPGGERPSGWELDKNRVDAGGKPVLDDDGNPVRGILPLRRDEADALAQARRDVPGGATADGRADLEDPGHLHPDREAVARTPSRAGAR